MAYVGNTPAAAYTSIAKQDITGNGGTSYTLDHSVANENEIEVFVNNVRQEPSIAYTVSGTALTMTGNVAASDDFYVVFQGKAIQTTSHPEGQDLQARDGTFSGDLTAAKFQTTANGIETLSGTDVSMSASADGQIRIDGNGYNGAIALDGSNMNIYTNSASRGIVFGTNETERMRIESSGSVTFQEGTFGTWKYLKKDVSFPTNATSVTITGIPANATEIQILWYHVNCATNDQKIYMRIGDSGGIETSGYVGGAMAANGTWRNESATAWYLLDDNYDDDASGIIDLAYMNGTGHRWVMRSVLVDPDSSGPSMDMAAGAKELSGTLTQFQFRTETGNFSDGEYSVRYR